MSAQPHRSDPRTLGRRTLQQDHRRLAELLRPGMRVLDVGCGTGSITAGIAEAVGPSGSVVGVDRDASLLAIAREEHSTVRNLRFESGDAMNLPFQAEFDIVTAARTIQWIADPARAISGMAKAAKPGGMLVLLDYNHEDNAWIPDPPAEFSVFYAAFLAWRQANHWDNRMADHLPELLRAAGLTEVESLDQNEVIQRGEADFPQRSRLWAEVIDNVGAQIAAAGFCSRDQVAAAQESYAPWVEADLMWQTLAMRAVTARTRQRSESGNGRAPVDATEVACPV